MGSVWCSIGLHTWQKGLTVSRGKVNLTKYDPSWRILVQSAPIEDNPKFYTCFTLRKRCDRVCTKCGKPDLAATIWLVKKASQVARKAEEIFNARKRLELLTRITIQGITGMVDKTAKPGQNEMHLD